MLQSPEEFGPLTPEEFQELTEHPLAGTPPYETEEDNTWHRTIIQNSPVGDPARARSERELAMGERYVQLKRRFDDFGAADVVTLKKDFTDIPIKDGNGQVVALERVYPTVMVTPETLEKGD
jgi:Uma2 family endonuclease